MRTDLALGVAVLALACAGAADAANRVEIKDAVARVTVIPENRPDVKVEFITTNGALPLKVRNHGDKLIVDGDLRRRIRGCHGGANWNIEINGRHSEGSRPVSVQVRGVGRVDWKDIPQIVVRTPMTADIGASGAVFGAVGRSNGLDLDNAGCGDWTIANVNGPLSVDVAGSGDTKAGSARSFRARIAGSGDMDARNIAGPANIDIAGSGDVHLASIAGPLDVDIAGSGDVAVDGGTTTVMDVHIAGSGDVDFGGAAQTLEVSIAGSGDVRAGSVSGQVKKSVLGSGSVYVGGKEIRTRRDRDRDHDDDGGE
jgi:putative autotransporter adhesin-like protein